MDDHEVAENGGAPASRDERVTAETADMPPRPVLPLRLTLQPHGLVVELNRRETVVGRHNDANLRLPLPDVSRRHCRFVFEEDAWQVADMDSLNGVYVNGTRVQKAVLKHHDTVRIASFEFRVDLHSAASTLALPPDEQHQVIRNITQLMPGPSLDQISRKAS